MNFTNVERPGRLANVRVGAGVLVLAVLTVLGVMGWIATGADEREDVGSASEQDRISQMNAVDAGVRQLEAWEIAMRDLEQKRISQTDAVAAGLRLLEEWENTHRNIGRNRMSEMNAMDAQEHAQEQIELQFPNGWPADAASDSDGD